MLYLIEPNTININNIKKEIDLSILIDKLISPTMNKKKKIMK